MGVELLQLPWRVVAVMLAGSKDYYQLQAQQLCAAFSDQFDLELHIAHSKLAWQEREVPRSFGKVFQHDVEQCRQVGWPCACLIQRASHVSLPSTALGCTCSHQVHLGHLITSIALAKCVSLR